MAVKLIAKKKVIAFPVHRMASSLPDSEVDLCDKKRLLRLWFFEWPLWFTSTGPYDCSCEPVFLNLIQLANQFSKYTQVRGSPH